MTKSRRIIISMAMLLISALLLGTASYAWFAMNTQTSVDGFEVEAYTDSLFLEISQSKEIGYGVETTFAADSRDLRLVTALYNTGKLVELSVADGTGTYNATNNGTYYEKVASDYGTNAYNYIDVTAKLVKASETSGMLMNPTFTLVKVHGAPAGDVYELDTKTHIFTKVTTEDAYGYYTVTYTAAGTYYDGQSTYYIESADGKTLTPATGLVVGSDLSQYYTVTAADADANNARSDGETEYYLVNTVNGKSDYSYVGTIPEDTVLNDYLFWGRAYSTDANDVQANNTLQILNPTAGTGEIDPDTNDPRNYYLAKTVYLRCAEGTNHASNLVIDEVILGGMNNAMTGALRVLFVATSSADADANATPAKPARISTCLYDAGTGAFTYSNGSNLFGTVLGNEAETIRVDIYIYFDGTDEDAKNSTIAGKLLNGQSVEIKFGIDELVYN